MNVVAAWERGYTGKGVVVTILDDGIERTHTDLMGNYVSRDTVIVVTSRDIVIVVTIRDTVY